MYSDRDIEHAVNTNVLGIDPWVPENLQPASIDVVLGSQFKVPISEGKILDLAEPQKIDYNVWWDVLVLEPGMFALAHTVEIFRIPAKIVAALEGKSSLARLGLLIHATAGFVDPGFEGQVTLELANVGNQSLLLRSGMRIGQMSFMETITPSAVPYGSPELGSKYQKQVGAQEAKWMP